MSRSNDSDEQEPLLRNESRQEDEVRELFGQYGAVHSVALTNDYETGRPRFERSGAFYLRQKFRLADGAHDLLAFRGLGIVSKSHGLAPFSFAAFWIVGNAIGK